jgi:hypothetical protein
MRVIAGVMRGMRVLRAGGHSLSPRTGLQSIGVHGTMVICCVPVSCFACVLDFRAKEMSWGPQVGGDSYKLQLTTQIQMWKNTILGESTLDVTYTQSTWHNVLELFSRGDFSGNDVLP